MIFDEYKTYNWIEKIKDKRKKYLMQRSIRILFY